MLKRDLSQIVTQLFGELDKPFQQSVWRPHADIYRCRDGWMIKVELAGVGEADVKVSTRGKILKIEGRRRDLSVQETVESHTMEIAYHRFDREITLPINLETSQIKTEYQQGMLLIRIRADNEENER